MHLHPKARTRWSIPELLLGILIFSPHLVSAAEPIKFKALRQQAELHERKAEWDKACSVYESILRLDRTLADVQDRYQICMRRYWQAKRCADLSYRKDVLSLDYAQSLRLYTMIHDTLLENALDKKKVDSGSLFRQGVEEFECALSSPYFTEQYLPSAQPRDIGAFRLFLKKMWISDEKLTRPQALKQVREVALAAQSMLQLSCNVVFMEFACGACHALDEYTLYLTPNELRALCDSLRGDFAGVDLTLPMEDGSARFTPSVDYHMKNDRIGYLHITCFQATTVQEVEDAVAALSKDGMKAALVDIRGNSGGVFEAAVDLARRFLPAGVIASTQNSDSRYSTVYHARNPNAFTFPVVVLIDGETASAAEVLAGALKDNKRARLVGQTTFGKGCTQCVLKLPSAPGGVPTGGLRLTVAQFFSPEGLPYSGRGVSPHVPVEPLFMGSTEGIDPEMEAALLETHRLLAASK